MLLPSQKSSTVTRFYVKTGSGAYVESPTFRTHEEAHLVMNREFWKGRNPAIVRIVTIETVVEEGE